jgi:hypothetical protein
VRQEKPGFEAMVSERAKPFVETPQKRCISCHLSIFVCCLGNRIKLRQVGKPFESAVLSSRLPSWIDVGVPLLVSVFRFSPIRSRDCRNVSIQVYPLHWLGYFMALFLSRQFMALWTAFMAVAN